MKINNKNKNKDELNKALQQDFNNIQLFVVGPFAQQICSGPGHCQCFSFQSPGLNFKWTSKRIRNTMTIKSTCP